MMRRRVEGLVAAAAVVAAAATLGPATAAAPGRTSGVATHQVFTVPASGSFHFAGHGYGHGHGMSQYGAEGAARQGLSYPRILRFYYPHTSLARMRGKVRVLITRNTRDDLRVAARRGLRVVDRGTHRSYALPHKRRVDAWRLVAAGRRTAVEYRIRRDGRKSWHRFRLGKNHRARLAGTGEFRAKSRRLTLLAPGGPTTYRGALRAARPSRGSTHLATVNVLPIDAYVRGVVPLEMPTLWHTAAVRAQAVAARTYALSERAAHLHRYYQVCDTTLCQVYGGRDAETTGGNAAVRATAGRYLRYRGQPAFTQFSSSNGGWTVAGGRPYLPAKKDPYDGWSGNPVHSWTVRVRARVLEERYPGIGTLRRIVITSRTGGGQWKGRVLTARLKGSAGSRTVTGSDIAAAYGLRSTWFMPRA